MGYWHWFILYLFLTFVIGLTSTVITALATLKSRAIWMSYYLFLQSVFTLIMVTGGMFTGYSGITALSKNFPMTFNIVRYAHVFVTVPFLIFLFPVCMLILCDVPNLNRNLWIAGGGVASMVFGQHVLLFTGSDIEKTLPISTTMLDAGMFIAGVLTLVIGLRYSRQIASPLKRAFAKKFTLFCLLMFFSFVFDATLWYADEQLIRFLPLAYIVLCLMSAFHFIKYYLHSSPQTGPASTSTASLTDSLFGSFRAVHAR
jgi:hypothetical protein